MENQTFRLGDNSAYKVNGAPLVLKMDRDFEVFTSDIFVATPPENVLSACRGGTRS